MQAENYLHRKHLEESLSDSDQFALTLVVASMGYGKSTLIQNFLKSGHQPYVYLTFECQVQSPQYLWSMFSRQISKGFPEIGQKLMTLGFPQNASQFDKIIEILSSEISQDVSVVFDDYHLCVSKDFDAFIQRLVKANVEGLHLILVSRTVPNFGVDELILKGYARQIKSHLFELGQDDIKRYFLLQGHDLSPNEIERVHKESEGWISAVYLMRQYYSETQKLKTGWHIEKLIESAVTVRYSKEEIEFLKTICIFDSIHKDQAIAICDTEKVAFILEQLSQSNAFIRYDHERDVYRIHNIFRSYLLKKSLEMPPVISERERYKRAGNWCVKTGDILTGLSYLNRGKAYDEILNEFLKVHFTKIIDNNPDFIRSIFNSIPQEILYRHPLAYLGYIGFVVTNIDVEVGNHLLNDLENQMVSMDWEDDVFKQGVLGEIELIKGYMAFNQVEKMQSRFEKAHQMLKGISKIANQNKIITFGSPHFLYMYHTQVGQLEKTYLDLMNLFPFYSEMANGCGKGVENLLKAEYFLEIMAVEEAESEALKAIYRAETLQQISVIVCAQFVRARVAAFKGNKEEAQLILSNLESLVDQQNSPILSSATALVKGYIGGVLSCPELIVNWIKEGDIKSCDVLYQGLNFFYIVYGKYLLITEDFLKLDAICQDAKILNAILNQQLLNLHFAIFKVIVSYKLNRWHETEMSLQELVRISGPDQLKLIVQEYGKWLLPILSSVHLKESDRVFFENLKSHMEAHAKHYNHHPQGHPLIDAFTKRELEVLNHMVSGKTNKEIAAELFVAEVTVRKHVTSIYKKLDVNGRPAAIAKILKKHLLP